MSNRCFNVGTLHDRRVITTGLDPRTVAPVGKIVLRRRLRLILPIRSTGNHDPI
jgi:hypothetical protein